MKKLFREFKQFISKGNIIDLAIAVVIGNAFNKIVNSLVNSVIMPLIGLATGGASVADWKWVITPANPELGISENAIAYGIFLQAIIDFLIIALCLFFALKIVKASSKRLEKARNVLKKEIRELNKYDKKRLKKQGIIIEKLKIESDSDTVEMAIKRTETVPAPLQEEKPSKEQELLTEIRDLLAAGAVKKEPQESSGEEQN